MSTKDKPLALAMSGGGIRAMVFHLGVLRYLAECKALERVTHISSVSGGSLVIGLLLQETDLVWPTSQQYLEYSLPNLRNKLCSQSLMKGMVRQLKKPGSWRFLLSRANLLAKTLHDEWDITDQLSKIPLNPEWSINGTTAETGKRFRFKRHDLGDYILGYACSENFPLAYAMAVSAAFPGGIGPLVINSDDYAWKKRNWNEPVESAQSVELPYNKLHLYDGGVYDNLGLEPFFNAGNRTIKPGLPSDMQIVVSDAGAPLQQGFSFSRLNPWRMKRVLDIMSDQSRALRVRTFMSYIDDIPEKGAYIYIGDSISDTQPCPSSSYASSFPTTLRKLKYDEFGYLMKHGYKLAKQFLTYIV